MIHYSIWFNLKNAETESNSLDIIEAFLSELYSAGSIAGFQLLKKSGRETDAGSLRFQALIEFHNDSEFATAFSDQAARGIRNGLHGQVMALVSGFRIEVFRQIAASSSTGLYASDAHYSCEV